MCVICSKDREIYSILTIRDCPLIERISLQDPMYENVLELYLINCPNLSEINGSCGLTYLYLLSCPKFVKIPQLKNLKCLVCLDCDSLTKIPMIKGMETIRCVGCRLLTQIPQHSRKHSYGVKTLYQVTVTDCHWSELSKEKKEMRDQIEKLVKLQKWYRRMMLSRRLTKLIPCLMPIYYHPQAKGGYFEKKYLLDFVDSLNNNH